MADDFVLPSDQESAATSSKAGAGFALPSDTDGESAPQEQGWGQTALDVGKQIGAGLAAGAEALPGATASLMGMVGHGVESGVRALGLESPEVAEQIRQREALKQQIQSGMPTLEKAGIIPEPETTAGQFTRTASEFVPAALAGPGGLTRRVLTGAVAPGVASEAAGQATSGTAAEPYARAAATFMPFGRIRPGEIHPSFDAETLFESGSQKYKAVDALDTQWKPQAISALGDRINASLSGSGFNRKTNDAVYSVIDQMRGIRNEAAAATAPPKGIDPNSLYGRFTSQKLVPYEPPAPKEVLTPFVSAGDIDAMRRQLRDVDHSQSAASYRATKMLDDYMANTKQGDLLQGDARQASQLLKAARDDWAAAYRTQIAQGKIALGQFHASTGNSGMNVDNSIRQAIKQLVRPNAMGEIPAKKLGYNDDEIAGLTQIAKGTKTRDFIRFLGNSMPGSGGGFLTGSTMIGAGAAAYYEGDPRYLWGAALAPMGLLLRKGANRITEQEAAKVADLISRRSSLGRATPSTIIPSQAPELGEAAALRAGTALQEPEQRKTGGRVNARPVQNLPRGRDNLFIEPAKLTPQVQMMLDHNRERFAKHFNYADEYGSGDPNSYDSKGDYNCGRCNQAQGRTCLLIKKNNLNLKADSCRQWESIREGDPEMFLQREGIGPSAYGIAKNGQGFGCHRCPFSKPARNRDDRGRTRWCGLGGFHQTPTACCELNGAETV